MNPKFATLLSSLLFATATAAAPAHWYLWQSRLDGRTFCSQVSPGEGWIQLAGPFLDARCERRA